MKINKAKSVFLIGVLMVLCLAAWGTAAVEITSGLTSGKAVFDVSYEVLDDDDDNTESLNYSKNLVFENKGNVSETVILEIPSAGVPAGYTLSLSNSDGTPLAGAFTLNALGQNGSSKTVILKAVVPVKEDSGTHTIGELKVSGTSNQISPIAIESKIKSMLKIQEIKVYVNGQSEDAVNSDGEPIEKVRPGSTVELRFEIENLFNDKYANGDIDEGGELTVEFEDEDDEDDFDGSIEEEADFEIDAGEELEGDEAIVITFEAPSKAKEKTYKLSIRMEGEDDNKALHVVEWTNGLEIDRTKDDVRLEEVFLTTSTLKCGVKETKLKATITNFGSNDQKKAALRVYSEEASLKLDQSFADIFLDKDPDEEENSISKTVTINVGDEVKAGEYSILVRAFIDNDDEVDGTFVKLVVEACPTAATGTTEGTTTETATEETESEVVVETLGGEPTETPTGATTATTSSEEQIVETTETIFGESNWLLVLMGVIAVLLVVLIGMMFFTLMTMKKGYKGQREERDYSSNRYRNNGRREYTKR